MDVKRAEALRRDLAQKVTDLVKEYEIDTGLHVMGIHFKFVSEAQNTGYTVYGCEIQVEL